MSRIIIKSLNKYSIIILKEIYRYDESKQVHLFQFVMVFYWLVSRCFSLDTLILILEVFCIVNAAVLPLFRGISIRVLTSFCVVTKSYQDSEWSVHSVHHWCQEAATIPVISYDSKNKKCLIYAIATYAIHANYPISKTNLFSPNFSARFQNKTKNMTGNGSVLDSQHSLCQVQVHSSWRVYVCVCVSQALPTMCVLPASSTRLLSVHRCSTTPRPPHYVISLLCFIKKIDQWLSCDWLVDHD